MAQVDAGHCRGFAPPEPQPEAKLVCIKIDGGLEVANDYAGVVLLTFDLGHGAGGHGGAC